MTDSNNPVADVQGTITTPTINFTNEELIMIDLKEREIDALRDLAASNEELALETKMAREAQQEHVDALRENTASNVELQDQMYDLNETIETTLGKCDITGWNLTEALANLGTLQMHKDGLLK